MRVATVQFAPRIGEVQWNIEKASKLLSHIKPGSVDLVCLPEMAFTGYMFEDSNSIAPHLEDPETGPTSTFCRNLSRHLQCYVTAGYPEKISPSEWDNSDNGNGEIVEKIGANSAVLYAPSGELVLNYRKTNLFYVDKTWSIPGSGLQSLLLPPPFGRTTLAICNDLNPHSTAWDYEVASHCLDNTSMDVPNTLILLNAWLDSQQSEESPIDLYTVRYWLTRLYPLFGSSEAPRSNSTSDSQEITVIICNRNGEEKGKIFAGSSSVFRLRPGSNDPDLVGVLTRKEESVGFWRV